MQFAMALSILAPNNLPTKGHAIASNRSANSNHSIWVSVKSRTANVTTNQLDYIKRISIQVLARDKNAWPFLKPVDYQKLNLRYVLPHLSYT